MTQRLIWHRFWRQHKMSKAGNYILSMLLWTWGGTAYYLLEVLWKTLHSEPEKISWAMLVLAIFLTIPIERFGYTLPWEMPLPVRAFICSVIVTVAEFCSGVVLNLWLHLNIWDYSHLWGNILGQICPQFYIVWYTLCIIFIVVFDYMRYLIERGTKPTYTFL